MYAVEMCYGLLHSMFSFFLMTKILVPIWILQFLERACIHMESFLKSMEDEHIFNMQWILDDPCCMTVLLFSMIILTANK
jgi:hypothetical protein